MSMKSYLGDSRTKKLNRAKVRIANRIMAQLVSFQSSVK